jgi:N-acetylneuraminic acid mutarotase
MVAGGTSSLADLATAISSVLATAEIWNPATGTWSAAASLGGRRLAPALTLLPNNSVMACGGVEVGFALGFPISASSTRNVQFYNATSNSWSTGPQMAQGRAGHHFNQVLLNDGRILFSGGVNVPSLLTAANSASMLEAELYDPVTNSWASANMSAARSLHSANLLANGRVAVCGGAQGTLTSPTAIASVEVFDPATNTWSAAGPLTTARSGHAGIVTPDGLLVLLGGQGNTATLNTVEVLHF